VSFLRTKGHTNHGKALGVLAATHTFSAKMGWDDMATGMNQRPRQRPSWASCQAMLAPGLGSGNRAICGIQTVSRALSSTHYR
jgi:hypothetical protein